MDHAIEVIRNQKLHVQKKLTLVDVKLVVEAVKSGDKSLNEISIETNLPEEKVLDIVAEFGTWLTHVSGGTTLLPLTVERKEMVQTDLFTETVIESRKGIVTLASLSAKEQARACKFSKSQRKHIDEILESKGERSARSEVKKIIEEIYSNKTISKKSKKKSVKAPSKVVLVPEGFEKTSEFKRDVSKAFCAIIERKPDDEVITRFLQRHYGTNTKVLTFPMIASVWFFLKLGRAEELTEVSPGIPEFLETVIDSYDLLDVSRRDAIEVVDHLCSENVDYSDLSYLSDVLKKSFWLCEGEFQIIQRKLDTVLLRGSALQSLQVEIERFKTRVKNNPTRYKPSSVSELTLGQIRRIAQLSGIDVDNDAKDLENSVRERLKNLGLTSDLDKLLPAGVKAARIGRDEDFFEILQSRKLGELDWHLQLEEFFSSMSEDSDLVLI